jgi:hypothetical protein
VEDHCIITGISNVRNELLDPKDLIAEHVEGDGMLIVHVQVGHTAISFLFDNIIISHELKD